MRIYTKANISKVTKNFNTLIDALDQYDLVDIMLALSEQRGGITPLYDAVSEAQDELDEGSVVQITDKGARVIR